MRLAGLMFKNVSKMLDFYSQFNPSPLSIKQFIDFGEFFLPSVHHRPQVSIFRSQLWLATQGRNLGADPNKNNNTAAS